MDDQSYLSSVWQVVLFVVMGLLFVGTALAVSSALRPHRPNEEKLTSYESGEDPIGSGLIQFNVRFFVLALIFLLFEVEVVFLFPWAVVLARKERVSETGGAWASYLLIEMVIFMVVLIIGLAYVWVNGHLDWLKPHPPKSSFKSPVPKELYDEVNRRYS
jgi:NADH-quinone oxidoreductase subunit A